MNEPIDHIEHEGVIDNIDGNIAHIRVLTRSACASCHAKAACNPLDLKEKLYELALPKGLDFSVGETVMLIISQGKGILAVVLSYIFPLIVLLTALIIAIECGINEGLSGLISLASIGVYFLALRVFRNKLNNSFKVIVRKK